MSARVLLIGGYGNFGTFIAERLSRELAVIVAGRSEQKARALARRLNAEWAVVDIFKNLDEQIQRVKPDILVHTSGPFQEQGYDVAEACIRNRVHYLDLADGRAFVAGISRLDAAAKAAGVLVASGASTVPGLTSAIVREYENRFETLETLDFGIATAQQTNRGLATVKAVLGYAGRPFKTLIDSEMRDVYGWQGLCWRAFRGLGRRPLGNCDVPDLELFPRYFPSLRTIRFRAGLELPILHCGLWLLTWPVRMRLLPNLRIAAPLLSRMARWLDAFGTDDSGFYMEMTGRDASGNEKQVTFDLTARAGDGLMIPCTPAIVLALKLAKGEIGERGAMPCVGLVKLDEILCELRTLRIAWNVSG